MHVKSSDAGLETRPRYTLDVDEDVKKPNQQTNKKLDKVCALLADGK